MIYQLFLSIMEYLTIIYGYLGALRIKDLLDNLAWGLIFGAFVNWIWTHILMDVTKSDTVDEDMGIVKVEYEGRTGMKINPKFAKHGFSVLLGYIIEKLSPSKRIKAIPLLSFAWLFGLILLFIFGVGILLSLWDYFPKGILKNIPPGAFKMHFP